MIRHFISGLGLGLGLETPGLVNIPVCVSSCVCETDDTKEEKHDVYLQYHQTVQAVDGLLFWHRRLGNLFFVFLTVFKGAIHTVQPFLQLLRRQLPQRSEHLTCCDRCWAVAATSCTRYKKCILSLKSCCCNRFQTSCSGSCCNTLQTSATCTHAAKKQPLTAPFWAENKEVNVSRTSKRREHPICVNFRFRL